MEEAALGPWGETSAHSAHVQAEQGGRLSRPTCVLVRGVWEGKPPGCQGSLVGGWLLERASFVSG